VNAHIKAGRLSAWRKPGEAGSYVSRGEVLALREQLQQAKAGCP
jgi:hypothetical protein